MSDSTRNSTGTIAMPTVRLRLRRKSWSSLRTMTRTCLVEGQQAAEDPPGSSRAVRVSTVSVLAKQLIAQLGGPADRARRVHDRHTVTEVPGLLHAMVLRKWSPVWLTAMINSRTSPGGGRV